MAERKDWPASGPASPMPDLSAGLCQPERVPAGIEPDAWLRSGDPQTRNAAVRVCQACPVLASCQAWALSLPDTDTAIVGGLTRTGRRKIRVARRKLSQPAWPTGPALSLPADLSGD